MDRPYLFYKKYWHSRLFTVLSNAAANYRKISKICVNIKYENQILSELSITPDLAILELETRFPNMEDFSIPLMSQTNSFYPQEKSSELGILSFKFLINCKCFVYISFVWLFVFWTKNIQDSHCSQIDCSLLFSVIFHRLVI